MYIHFAYSVSLGEDELECSGIAYGTETYEAGSFYMPNGDPGSPDSYDFTIDEIDIEKVYDLNTGSEIDIEKVNTGLLYRLIEMKLRDENRVKWERD